MKNEPEEITTGIEQILNSESDLTNLTDLNETGIDIPELETIEAPEQRKDPRGRKKLSPEEKKRRRLARDRAAKKQTPSESETDEIDRIINEHNATASKLEAENIQPTESEQNKVTAKISGMILLTVIDAICPLAILKIGGLVDKRFKKIDSRKIQLTQEEKEQLSEIADAVAAGIEANPVLLLSISLGGIYLAKITGEF